MDEENKEEPAEEKSSKDEESTAVLSEEAPAKKRPLGLRLLIGFVIFLFFTGLYLTTGILAVGGGVGWYYLDENFDHDFNRVSELAAGARVVDAHGNTIGRIGATDRKLITREDISPTFVDALLAAEDQRYFVHPGFDPMGTLRAAIANYRAETIKEGGSTLTQQLARDVFGLEGKHIERKLNEIAIAFWMEREYSKDEILVHYLNRIYFGSGFYGAGAAAQGYFDKPLRELTTDEAAMMCGLIRSPSRLSPYVSRDLAQGARNQTLQRMVSIGRLSEGELQELTSRPTEVADNRDQRIHRGQASFLLARIEREARELVGDRSFEGLVIESSVDLEFQQSAAFEIDKHLKRLSREHQKVQDIDALEGAAVIVENETGRLLLTVGSRDFHGSEYDRSRNMKRPPGSAFLPFVYAAAFDSGEFGPESILTDAPFDNREMGLGGISGVLGEWSTENLENRWEGQISAAKALRLRKNSPTARLGLEVGLERVSEVASLAGIESPIRRLSGSLLGASEMSLSELVRAYTIFPNGGTPCPPLGLIESIREGEQVIFSSKAGGAPGRAISQDTAEIVASLIQHQQSGTTPAFTDGWHFGYNDQLTWGVWVGKDTFETIFPMAFGGSLARPIADAIGESSWMRGNPLAFETIALKKPATKKKASLPPVAQPETAALIGPDPYGTLGNGVRSTR